MANTTDSLAGLWYNQNYLSFDIATVKELQQSQVLELCFVARLFKSALNIDIINQLLISLPKPYAYDQNLVYFDVFANTWKMLPQELEEETVVENYLETIEEEENQEKLKGLIARLQDLLQE